MQAVNITNNLKIKVDFTLPTIIVKNIVTWTCHLDDSDKGRWDIILGTNILTELVLNLKLSEHVIEADGGPFKGSITPMIDLGMYIFKYYFLISKECNLV